MLPLTRQYGKVVAIAALALSPLALTACDEAKTAPVEQVVRPVKAQAVAFVRTGEPMAFAGTVAPRTESGLGFRVAGKVVERLVDVGATVKAGTVLARTTRRVALTEVGRVFYDHAARMLAEAQAAEAAVSALHELPRGLLRISLPVTFGLTHIAPAIPDFLQRCEEMRIDMTFSDRYVDLLEEGFDLAVRIARLTDSSLVARKLAPNRMVIAGSPDYLARHGEPKTPADLARHSCFAYTYAPDPDHWPLWVDGKLTQVKVNGRLRANNGEALRLCAVGHLGLVLTPTFMVGDDLRAGRLRTVMNDHMPVDSAIYAVYPSRRYITPKVRAFIDFLAGRFGPEPYWDRA